MNAAILTLRSNEKAVELEDQKRIGHFSQELLQERGKLNRIIGGEINSFRVLIVSFSEVFQPSNVSVPSKYTLHRHI